MIQDSCPNCGGMETEGIYTVSNVPVHDSSLKKTRDEAIYSQKRDIRLAFCICCGFVFNSVFDPTLLKYDSDYEATQGFSPTFSSFHKRLARSLIRKHMLIDKTIVEIGCGNGDFLNLLCEMGNNTGYGFDPSFIEDRSPTKGNNDVFILKDLFSEQNAHGDGDFYCCKMTLEHIPDTCRFLSMIRQSIKNREAVVYFMLPDAEKIFRNLEFWDIYYEHCSYFTAGSLEYVFQLAGFEVLSIGREYDDQYLLIEARPDDTPEQVTPPEIDDLIKIVNHFQRYIEAHKTKWKSLIERFHVQNKKIILWGGSSRSVSFLTTLGVTVHKVPYVVDINPHKQGTYLPGNGQMIISPAQLAEIDWDLIIVMNPIYQKEIEAQLLDMQLLPKLLPVDFFNQKQEESTYQL